MKCMALWYGGSNYAVPDGHNPRDCEIFNSLHEAARAFKGRADHDPYYPCVDDDTAEMHVYFGQDYHENGPDRIIRFGPRRGVRVERC